MPPENTDSIKQNNKILFKLIIVCGLIIISLFPYFFASMALMFVNLDLGLGIFNQLFNYLFYFLITSIVLTVISFLFFKKFIPAGNFSEFIVSNIKKVFFAGIVIYYLITIWSFFKNFNNLNLFLIMLVVSFFIFLIVFLMLSFGKKILKIVENSK